MSDNVTDLDVHLDESNGLIGDHLHLLDAEELFIVAEAAQLLSRIAWKMDTDEDLGGECFTLFRAVHRETERRENLSHHETLAEFHYRQKNPLG